MASKEVAIPAPKSIVDTRNILEPALKRSNPHALTFYTILYQLMEWDSTKFRHKLVFAFRNRGA